MSRLFASGERQLNASLDKREREFVNGFRRRDRVAKVTKRESARARSAQS